jgi:hypothetical protein
MLARSLSCRAGIYFELLIAGAGMVLRVGGLLLVYGPFKKDGKCTTDSNAVFDVSLRSQNPEWGYRYNCWNRIFEMVVAWFRIFWVRIF